MDFGPDDAIDYEHPVTPYRQLAEILRARVARGDWKVNRPLPSEVRLVQEYGLARTTVRRSIAVLVEEGVLFVVPQRGMYVAPRTQETADTDT